MSLNNNKNKGFSLLELVLAVAIFAVGSIVAGYMIIDANITTRINQQRDEANQIAREGIEAVTTIANGTFSNLNITAGSHGLATSSSNGSTVWQLTDSPDVSDSIFTRSIQITYAAATDAMATSAIATSSVAWTGPNGVSDSVSLTTFLTDWRNN